MTTETTQHTPGPWTIGLAPTRGERGLYSHVEYILINQRVETVEEAQSNARLIAAAPDLLAALEGLAGHLSGIAIPKLAAAYLDDARAAIRKARGAP